MRFVCKIKISLIHWEAKTWRRKIQDRGWRSSDLRCSYYILSYWWKMAINHCKNIRIFSPSIVCDGLFRCGSRMPMCPIEEAWAALQIWVRYVQNLGQGQLWHYLVHLVFSTFPLFHCFNFLATMVMYHLLFRQRTPKCKGKPM